MDRVQFTGDRLPVSVWTPLSGDHFPNDQNANLSIEVVGARNLVRAQGVRPEVDKPTVALDITAGKNSPRFIFGASFDEGEGEAFESDNVSITPVVTELGGLRKLNYELRLSARAIPGDRATR